MNFITERSIRELNSLGEYTKFLSNFPVIKNPSRSVEIGQLYACDEYDFSTDYPQETLNRFDKRPLQLVFNKNSTHYWAVSIHFLPVLHRASILKKVLNTNPLQFKDPKFDKMKIRLSYVILQSISRRATDAIRCYRYDRVNNLRRIPLDKWSEASQFSPNTFVNSSMEAILKKLRKNK